jgi:hypothetical protein
MLRRTNEILKSASVLFAEPGPIEVSRDIESPVGSPRRIILTGS